MTPLRLSRRARSDANEAATWYATQGGLALELVFAYALRAVYELIQQYPGIGSTRHAEYASDLPTPLRLLPLKRFAQHLIYYIERPQHVLVIRTWYVARGLDALIGDGA